MYKKVEWKSNEDKIFFIKFYKDFSIFDFICNDLFENLNRIIKITTCISKANINNKKRILNYFKVFNIIYDFLLQNNFYKKRLELIYEDFYFIDIIFELIDCYVFFLSKTNHNFYNINVFNDKTSICYENNFNFI